MCIEEMRMRLSPEQLCEALGQHNRYFAWLTSGHDPTEEEAIWHYFMHCLPYHLITFDVANPVTSEETEYYANQENVAA